MFDSIDEMRVPIPVEDNGFMGRECPKEDCQGYFKIKLGTGIIGEGYNKCYCPYCGHESTQDYFFTKEQIEYAKSIAVRKIQKTLRTEIKKWDRNLRSSTRNSFFKLRVDYKQSYHPVAYYAEKELETHTVCESCTLEYAVYGKFAYCPDCGADNTLQILGANLDLVRKLLAQAEAEEDAEFQEYLVQNALEDVISSFDSFGRNCVNLFTKNTDNEGVGISFQNIKKARDTIQDVFGFDFCDELKDEDWIRVEINFQKRHLISHNDGIIDDVYIQKTNDQFADVGRKVVVTPVEVEEMLQAMETEAKCLQEGLANWKSQNDNEGG